MGDGKIIEEGICNTGEDGKVVWREVVEYPIQETGCMIIAYEEAQPWKVYHLHGSTSSECYRWRMLWNSCGHNFGGSTDLHLMVREMEAREGWVVRRMGYRAFARWFFNQVSRQEEKERKARGEFL